LEEVEKGIYETAKFWREGSRSLVAAFKLEQDRMDNAFHILGQFRQTIRDIQRGIIESRMVRYRDKRLIQSLLIRFNNNDTVLLAEIDALYNGVQTLMNGHIPHFILPYSTLLNAINRIAFHLDKNQPHMTLSCFDMAYYYNEAKFQVFRKGNVLCLVIDAPVTNRALSDPFHLYDVVKLPVSTPESHDFYNLLATNIKP